MNPRRTKEEPPTRAEHLAKANIFIQTDQDQEDLFLEQNTTMSALCQQLVGPGQGLTC